MFWKNTKEESEEVARLNKVLDEKDKSYDKQWLEMKEDHEKEIINLKKDHEVIINRKEAEVDVKVSTAVKEKDTKIAKLELENGNYKKEVEILTKAFENLGFDVKDMKEILNKLVDGIVSKNQIQLVK